MPPSGVTRINQLLSPCSFETLTLDIHDLAPFSLGNESRAIPDDGAIFGKSLNVEKLSNGFAKLVDACIETMKPTQTCACRNPRSHSLFVNLMLPGESLALHRDVPEFWGLGHYNAPHWLLHLMANSSLFDNFRLPLATCVYWVSAPPGGDLILQLHAGFEEHIQAQSNDAVIFDADAIPHRVAPVGGGATARALTRDNATLSSSGLDGWELTSSAGCLKFPSEALRISMVYKASCLCAVERCWANGSPISLESAVFQLASSLEYEDKIGGIADPEGLLKAIFKSFLGSPK